jgi:calcium permeable stress-gated cation channel
LILGFAGIGLYLFYLSYRYNLLYVAQPKVDSKGECYGRALQHMFTGVYLSQLCLIGLFGARGAAGPSTLMVILLVATVLYHIMLNRVLKAIKSNFASREQGELAPLLEDEDDDVERRADQRGLRSKAARMSLGVFAPEGSSRTSLLPRPHSGPG